MGVGTIVVPHIFFSGILAGGLHTLSGVDHLAAVSPLVATSGKQSWRLGLSWGSGHFLSVTLMVCAAWWARSKLPLERLSDYSEWLVGLMLIGLGIWAVRRGLRDHVHMHEHDHGGHPHVHIHLHPSSHQHNNPGTHARHTHASFAIGALHGLAGSSHILAILPALAMRSLEDASSYLFGFGLSSILTMSIFSVVLRKAGDWLARRFSSAHRWTTISTGALAILVGIVWVL